MSTSCAWFDIPKNVSVNHTQHFITCKKRKSERDFSKVVNSKENKYEKLQAIPQQFPTRNKVRGCHDK